MASANKKKETVRAAPVSDRVDPARRVLKEVPVRFRDALTIAKETGLLRGSRTELVRGRMPKALVAKAKARSGVQSDTKLIEVALATLAVADEYPAWLLAQQGTVSRDLDLEF